MFRQMESFFNVIPGGPVKYGSVHMSDQAFSKQPLNEFGSLPKKRPLNKF